MDSNFYYARWGLGETYAMQGDFQRALAEYLTASKQGDDPGIMGLVVHAQAMSGKREEALKTLDQMKQFSRSRYVPAIYFAEAYAGLGQKDEAFQWLEKSYLNHEPVLSFMKVDPSLDNLHSDPCP